MPQPIRKLPNSKPNGVLANIVDPFQMTDAQLVAKAMRVISTWAAVENAQTGAFIKIIGGQGTPAGAAFLALDSRGARTSAILAAASHRMHAEDIDRLRAVLPLTSRFARFRDKIAHWQPVSHPSYDDHIVMKNPLKFKLIPNKSGTLVEGLFKIHQNELIYHSQGNAALASAFHAMERLEYITYPPTPPDPDREAVPSARKVIDDVINELESPYLRERSILKMPKDWPDWLKQGS